MIKIPVDALARARAGYVEYPTGPSCSSCEYADQRQRVCQKFGFTIDLKDGCCDAWEAKDKKGKDWRKDLEARGSVEVEAHRFVLFPTEGGPFAAYREQPKEEE